jgi:hypothetical protein
MTYQIIFYDDEVNVLEDKMDAVMKTTVIEVGLDLGMEGT